MSLYRVIAVIFSYLFFSDTTLATTNLYNTHGVTTRTIGSPNSLGYRVYFEKDNHVISAFHDVPLFANREKTIFNMIVEMPRWTNAKNEINKEEPLNPIKQDVKNQQPRFVANIFPLKGYSWNYGAFPQTWENPKFISPYTGKGGDNDPIDVIEIGQEVATVGQIKQVKVLGVIGLIDQEETDWKVVTIDINDPLADQLNDILDVQQHMPGYMEQSCIYFKQYKVPTGGNRNEIAFEGKPQNKKFATNIVLETHEQWQLLVNGTEPKKTIQAVNLSVKDSPYRIDPDNDLVTHISKANPLPPTRVPPIVNKWYFFPNNQTESDI
ncbi:inorganic pyrophosphatase [Blakeslea trispora]|nr:inorganic pyrophosphatase [Blakeslea trispora]